MRNWRTQYTRACRRDSSAGRRRSTLGRSNVVFWLEQHRVPVTDDVVDRVFAGAKASSRVLSDVEIEALIASGPPNRVG